MIPQTAPGNRNLAISVQQTQEPGQRIERPRRVDWPKYAARRAVGIAFLVIVGLLAAVMEAAR